MADGKGKDMIDMGIIETDQLSDSLMKNMFHIPNFISTRYKISSKANERKGFVSLFQPKLSRCLLFWFGVIK